MSPSSGLSSTTPSRDFAFVANGAANDVAAFAIDAKTGALTPIAGSPFAAGTGVVGVMVDPSGQFVYTANNVPNDVSAYTIDKKVGTLTPILGSPFAAGNSPQPITTDPLGRFAYVTNSGDKTISAYTIDKKTGVLTLVSGSPFATGNWCNELIKKSTRGVDDPGQTPIMFVSDIPLKNFDKEMAAYQFLPL
jgi:6-phosphogluconolactonase